MIPTYNRTDLLRKTLESVLQQDPGPAEMQIQVLDNGSTVGHAESIVREMGSDRVEWFREPTNIGSQNIFTECIQRARGHWVQILHDDDMVMPGFYDAYQQVIQNDPELVMVYGQVIVIDEHDRWRDVGIGPPPLDGNRIEDLPRRLMLDNCTQYVSTVVRRDAYEKTGGFCNCFEYLADWDLWFRVSQIGPAAMVPRPYAFYRVHPGNGGNALRNVRQDISETFRFKLVNLARMVLSDSDARAQLAEAHFEAGYSWRQAGSYSKAVGHLAAAIRWSPRTVKYYCCIGGLGLQALGMRQPAGRRQAECL